ncbi:MAG: hypothetical protein WAO19_05140 [Candidatus Kryptoniota bacterium]
MTRSLLINSLFLICTSFSVVAQQTGNTTAVGGPEGIYVALGTNLPTSSRPINGGVAYLVDRRVSGEQGWQEIATISAPTSIEEFRSRLEKSMPFVPVPISLSQIPVDTLWQMISKYGDATRLQYWSGALLVRLASGMVYLDTTAQRGAKYQYRVSLVDQSKRALAVFISNVESFPDITYLPKLRLFEKSSDAKQAVLAWTSGRGKRASIFRAYRQDGLSGEFKPVAVLSFLNARHDSTFYLIEDTVVKPVEVYRYYLSPMDYYGNPGVASDTATVGTYEFQHVPLPDFLRAVSLDSAGGIRVSWRFPDPRLVRDLTIYRSTDYSTGYVRLSSIATGDSSYRDQNVKPMVKYFYYLVMHGPLGESSPPSAKVFGMFIDSFAPVAPGILGADGMNNGVRLLIAATDNRQISYQIYRNDGIRPELSLISGLLPKRDSVTLFIDTSNVLSGKLTYAYSVRAENESHIFSKFSDTIHVRPNIPTHPQAPMEVSATMEGKAIQLYWNDMRSMDGTARGYFVFRREAAVKGKQEGKFRRLMDSLLTASHNRYADTTAVEGRIYEYAVQAVDVFGGASPMSTVSRAEIIPVTPIPPGGVRARLTTAGIMVQWDGTSQPDLKEYRVYRYERRRNPISISTVRPADPLKIIDKSAKKGTLYFYFITAVDAKGVESDRSQEVGIRK